MERARSNRSGWWIGPVVGIWLVTVVSGAVALWDYKLTPGAAAAAPAIWPAGSRITRDGARPTLVMLAHPRCSCTRASIAELARLMTDPRADVLAAHVVFARPDGTSAEWIRTATWEAASAIPGVRVWADPSGVEAERFGGVTSGQVLLYDRRGELRFAGGITPARGHQGDSAGRDAVLAELEGSRAARAETTVFGCPIF